MSRAASSAAAAATASAAADGSALKPTTYRPSTIAGMSTALLPARDSLGSMIATAPAAARKQARADAEERKEEESAANGEHANKRMRMTLSEEAAQQRAAAAAAAGGAAGSGSPALSSSRVPPPMPLSRSFSVPGAAGGPSSDAAAAAAGDHGLGFDLNANVEDDFFDYIDPGSARNSLWNAQGLANLRANAVTTPVPAAAAAAASSASAAAAAAAAAADDASFAPLTFPDPPLDWNLHSRIRFTSPSPFDWVSASSPAAMEHALEGVQTFMALGRADACSCKEVSPLRELHHALSYSTFPASPFGKMHPLTSVLRTALNKPREQRGQMDQLQLTHLQLLWIQWEDSFRSLYHRTRLPPSSPAWLDHFYSINRGGPGSGGGLLTYSVLFLAADPDEGGDDMEGSAGAAAAAPGSLEKAPAALISRSNRGLRAMLTAKGVGFSMPNDPRSQAENGSPDGAMVDGPEPLTRQLSAQQRQRINQTIADEDLTCASVLLVQGRKDVHALFDTLLTQDRTSRELDLPALFASAPFLNAVTRQVNIINIGQAKSAPGGAAGGAEDKINKNATASASTGLDDVYTLDLAGPLLPSSVVRLLSLLQSTQPGGCFTAHFAPSDFPPSYFNCVCTDRVLSLDGLRSAVSLGIGGQDSLAQHTSTLRAGKRSLRHMGSLRRVKATSQHFRVQLNTQQQT